ncbi:MAG: hypothetical protein AB2L11_03230 [Syntrophobacteraceae bacterium]
MIKDTLMAANPFVYAPTGILAVVTDHLKMLVMQPRDMSFAPDGRAERLSRK